MTSEHGGREKCDTFFTATSPNFSFEKLLGGKQKRGSLRKENLQGTCPMDPSMHTLKAMPLTSCVLDLHHACCPSCQTCPQSLQCGLGRLAGQNSWPRGPGADASHGRYSSDGSGRQRMPEQMTGRLDVENSNIKVMYGTGSVYDNTMHFTFYSLADLANLTPSQFACCTDCQHKYPPLFIAKCSFIQLSELEQCGVN